MSIEIMVATPGVRSFASDTPATRAKSWEIRDKILPVVSHWTSSWRGILVCVCVCFFIISSI